LPTWAGHTFGLLGQGPASEANNGTAFDAYNKHTGPDSTYGMMISIFPYD